jgi:hypothetical protein
MNLPIFSANTMPASVPYQSSPLFTYDSSMNPYNIQESSIPQNYAIAYSSALSPKVSYIASSAPQPLHTIREVHDQYSLYGDHIVQSESAYPVQSAPIDSGASYATNYKQFSFEPAEATNLHVATDIDMLIKAIQAKQMTSPQKQKVAKVSPNKQAHFGYHSVLTHSRLKSPKS